MNILLLYKTVNTEIVNQDTAILYCHHIFTLGISKLMSCIVTHNNMNCISNIFQLKKNGLLFNGNIQA